MIWNLCRRSLNLISYKKRHWMVNHYRTCFVLFARIVTSSEWNVANLNHFMADANIKIYEKGNCKSWLVLDSDVHLIQCIYVNIMKYNWTILSSPCKRAYDYNTLCYSRKGRCDLDSSWNIDFSRREFLSVNGPTLYNRAKLRAHLIKKVCRMVWNC